MINSLFMLGGAYNKDKKISIIFIAGWILYMLVNHNYSLGCVFPIINTIVLLVVTISINMIKNRKVNTILSILSILIWSIIIDIICFFVYPTNENIFIYVFQGIIFNYKYVFTNIFAMVTINLIIYAKKNIVNSFFNKKNVYNGI